MRRSPRAAVRRVLRALVAVPLQIVAVVRGRGGWPDDATGAVSRARSTVIGLPAAVVANAASLVMAFTVARAVYYAFWAAGASQAQLERSWGGPNAVGATLVHWLVAIAIQVIMYVVIVVMARITPKTR